MTLAVLNIEWQTLADATALGAVYALMAVGIGLVFGVLRLVNFAYGQLIMAGAYTLAYTSAWPVVWSIVAGVAERSGRKTRRSIASDRAMTTAKQVTTLPATGQPEV